jgi:hypothetical protein
MYGNCTGVVRLYSRKKTGRLQQGDWPADTHVAAVVPLSAVPLPKLAHAEHVAVASSGAPEHVVLGAVARTVASLVVPSAHRHTQSASQTQTQPRQSPAHHVTY